MNLTLLLVYLLFKLSLTPPHLQMCLKCADLGHLASAKEVHREWVHRLESEVGSEGEGVLTAYLALA